MKESQPVQQRKIAQPKNPRTAQDGPQQVPQRKQQKSTRKIPTEEVSLEIVHPDAAGIDIGNEAHYVAVPPTRDPQSVRRFGCVTAELKSMAEWLQQCGIRTVAMQSTGVYWIPVYDILEEAGLTVFLVNARETKNLPGKKTDVQESQWLMKLHTYGLLRNSFRPAEEIRRLRTYWRQRNDLLKSAGRHIQRVQKVLTQMNVQLANVISDLSGLTGQAIVKAILNGERDPQRLAAHRDKRIHASTDEIARSLEGNWQEDLLFVLQQEQAAYEFCQKQMADCDAQLQRYFEERPDRTEGAVLAEETHKGRRRRKRGHTPLFDLRQGLFRLTGADLTRLDGVDVMTATTIVSEAGWDMTRWRTEDHFVSWLRLCPDNRISGDRVIGKGRLPTQNRLNTAFRIAATALRTSDSYLGAQFRRLRARLGGPIAIKAMAAKLARLAYRMLRYGMEFVDKGAAFYETRQRQRQISQLQSKAVALGLQVVETVA